MSAGKRHKSSLEKIISALAELFWGLSSNKLKLLVSVIASAVINSKQQLAWRIGGSLAVGKGTRQFGCICKHARAPFGIYF